MCIYIKISAKHKGEIFKKWNTTLGVILQPDVKSCFVNNIFAIGSTENAKEKLDKLHKKYTKPT